MIKGKQAVVDFFRQLNEGPNQDSGNIHFSIYTRGGEIKGSPCIRTPEGKEGWNYEQAIDFLNRWLSLQSYGEFVITVNDKEKTSERGSVRQAFSIALQDGITAAVSGPPAPSAAEIDQMVTARVEGILTQKEQERELKELRAKVIQLERDNKVLIRKADSPWNVLITEIRPYIGNLLEEQGLIKTKVAGPNTVAPQAPKKQDRFEPLPDDDMEAAEVNAEPDPELQGRVEAAVKNFMIARPDDWLEVMEYLGEKLKANPGLFEKAKLFL